MQRFLLRLFIVLFVVSSASLSAQQNESNIKGIWGGTVGASRALACFDTSSSGNYYYLAHLYSNTLFRDDHSTNWNEGDDLSDQTGMWQNVRLSANELKASWVAPHGGPVLLIHLHRIANLNTKDGLDRCRISAFDQPRVKATAIDTAPESKLGQWRVRKLSAFDHNVETIQFIDPSPGLARLNQTLVQRFSRHIVERYECKGHGDPGDFNSWVPDIPFANSEMIVIGESADVTCGGPHPSESYVFHTFDLHTGNEIDATQWIRMDHDKIPKGLLDIINTIEIANNATSPKEFAEWRTNCEQIWRQQKGYDIQLRPAENSVHFMPEFAHAFQACGDEVSVPFEKLEPYLSEAGRKALHRPSSKHAAP